MTAVVAEHVPSRTRYQAGCRCPGCTEAQRLYHIGLRSRLQARRQDAPHGTASAYCSWGCRCGLCKEAGRAHNATQAAKRRQAAGLPLTPWQQMFVTA